MPRTTSSGKIDAWGLTPTGQDLIKRSEQPPEVDALYAAWTAAFLPGPRANPARYAEVFAALAMSIDGLVTFARHEGGLSSTDVHQLERLGTSAQMLAARAAQTSPAVPWQQPRTQVAQPPPPAANGRDV